MLTERFADAFGFADRLHSGQTRKGTTIPYISHPMAVSALVLEHGGLEDAAIAALLHDAVEDQGGVATARLIAERFGSRVGALVMACTDAAPADGAPKPDWFVRKRAFISAVPKLSPEAALIVTCDKLHNLGAMLRDVRRDGLQTLQRFKAPERLHWYFSSLAWALSPFAASAPVGELHRLAEDFGKITGAPEVFGRPRDW